MGTEAGKLNWLYLLDSFEGRIGRKTFWIAMSIVTVAEIVGHLLAERIEGDRLNAIVDLIFTYPELAIAVKRGFDRNMPFWIVGAFFAAGVVLDFLTVLGFAGTYDKPSVAAVALAIPFTILRIRSADRAWLPQGHDGPEPVWARSARQGLTLSGPCSILN